MTTIAIVPARGGSKGIPRKNLVDFCGRPLLEWTILHAREAKTIDAVYVSSDDEEILRLARAWGAVPVHRPAHLAGDTASSEAALLHVLDGLAGDPDEVVFLQATSPLREAGDIDGAVQTFRDAGADSLFTGHRLEDVFIWVPRDGSYHSLNFDHLNRPRRQDVEAQYLENGSMYIFRPQVLRRGNRMGGKIAVHEMEAWKAHELDSWEDHALMSWYFQTRLQPARLPGRDAIDLIVYDFDGVLTDDRVLTLEDGTEGVVANRADGLAMGQLRDAGFEQVIISKERNPVVTARGAKVGVSVMQGIDDKVHAVSRMCQERNTSMERVLFIGNDLNDIPLLQCVGWSAAPSDAHAAARAAATWKLTTAGGAGICREVATQLLAGKRASYRTHVQVQEQA